MVVPFGKSLTEPTYRAIASGPFCKVPLAKVLAAALMVLLPNTK